MHAYEPPGHIHIVSNSCVENFLYECWLTRVCMFTLMSLSLLIWGKIIIICSSIVNSGTVYCHRPSSPKVKCNKVLFLSYGKSTHYTPYWNATAINNSILFCTKSFNASPHRSSCNKTTWPRCYKNVTDYVARMHMHTTKPRPQATSRFYLSHGFFSTAVR